MAFDFILMLTSNDRTIPDASAKLEEALKGGVRHIGFKDVGLSLAELKALADAIRAAGGRSYLEVVSLDGKRSSPPCASPWNWKSTAFSAEPAPKSSPR